MSMNTGTDPIPSEAVFATPGILRDAFENRLTELLELDRLGVFILVLANACFERQTFDRLQRPLALAFERWRRRLHDQDPCVMGAPADDIEVLRRLCALGFEHLGTTRWRSLGPWQLQFNPLRALRPPRLSHAVPSGLRQAFDAAGFHFNRPFLHKEIFWQGCLAGTPLRLLYNKFPFAELHGLLVPDPQACKPQFLTRQDHELVWRIGNELGPKLPGLGFAYNAYGAYASVNHLHFQMFVRSQGRFPVESSRWCHNGGPGSYPVPVQCHEDSGSAWQGIQRLHAAGRPYNLLYRPGRVYVLGRAVQGGHVHAAWTTGFAWSEMAGAITVTAEEDFLRLTESDLQAEFRRLAATP
jgi:hypothetical protein